MEKDLVVIVEVIEDGVVKVVIVVVVEVTVCR